MAQILVAQDEYEVFFEEVEQLAWVQIGTRVAKGKFGAEGSREGANLPSFEACGWVHEQVNGFLDRQEFWIPDFRQQI